jgi:hypothetical protein
VNYPPGWTGVVATALSMLASVLLVWQGHSFVQNLNDTTQQLALSHTAYNDPAAICTNARQEANGLVSNSLWLRCGQNQHGTCPPQQAVNVTDRPLTATILDALFGCGSISGFYFSSSLSDIIDGDVSAAQLMAANMQAYNVSLIAQTVAHAPGPPDHPWSRIYVTGVDKAWVQRAFGLGGEASCLADLIRSFPAIVNGVWRIALGFEDFLELNLRQNRTGATCVARSLAAAGVFPGLCTNYSSAVFLSPLGGVFDAIHGCGLLSKPGLCKLLPLDSHSCAQTMQPHLPQHSLHAHCPGITARVAWTSTTGVNGPWPSPARASRTARASWAFRAGKLHFPAACLPCMALSCTTRYHAAHRHLAALCSTLPPCAENAWEHAK